MPELGREIVTAASEPIDLLFIPDTLVSQVEDHKRNIYELAISLLDAGIDTATVESSIKSVVLSFSTELSATIIALKEQDDVL